MTSLLGIGSRRDHHCDLAVRVPGSADPVSQAARAEGRRRPYAIVAGLILSFAIFTLFAAWILDRLGLPKDLLRNISIGLLFLLAATLVVPRIGELLERPFLFLTRRRSGDLGGGFLLGASLGLVFVPCAGPVLGVITTQAARLDSASTRPPDVPYSLGAAAPMLAIAAGGQRAAVRPRVPPHAREIARRWRGDGPRRACDHVRPRHEGADRDRHYTSFLQEKVEETSYARKRLAKVTGADKSALQRAIARARTARPSSAARRSLPRCPAYGRAPEFTGNSPWLNHRRGRP